jgi:YegS/Rv2252/BmrU family lipid kinase
MNDAVIIVNPASGRGHARSLLPTVLSTFANVGVSDIRETQGPGDEESVAGNAIADGARTIIAVGGDGTCSRIANAVLRSGIHCSLAVIPCGTGNDFAKTLGVVDWTPAQIAQLLVSGTTTSIDVGACDGHYFLNSCGFGFDASVLEASNRVRFLKGDAVYIYSALRQLFTYRGMDVSANGVAALKAGRMLMVTVSNGRYLGGAFRIAPHASVVDGKLDACFFGDSNVVERARLFAGALRGTHPGMRGVTSASVQELSLTFAAPPSMEIDGELRVAQFSTVRLECMPRALSVLAAPGALA